MPQMPQMPQLPQVPNAPRMLHDQVLKHLLGPRSQAALAQATSPQEWTTFLLSSPELMRR
jgi:hypothetical protein